MRLPRSGWYIAVFLSLVALPVGAAQHFTLDCRPNRIATGSTGAAHIFRAPLNAVPPGNDSVDVRPAKHLPEGWTATWSQKSVGVPYSGSHRIGLISGQQDSLLIEMIPSAEPSVGYIDLTVRGAADSLDVDRCTYAYFAGQPIPPVQSELDCGPDIKYITYDPYADPPDPFYFKFRSHVTNPSAVHDSIWVQLYKDLPDNWIAQLCTGSGICYFEGGVLQLPPGGLDTLKVDFIHFGNAGVGAIDMEVHSMLNPGLVHRCHFQCIVNQTAPVDAPASSLPVAMASMRAAPNPFSEGTTLRLRVTKPATGALSVFGADGRIVRSFPPATVQPGATSFYWNGRSDDGGVLPSGVYFYRFHSDQQEDLRGVVIRTR